MAFHPQIGEFQTLAAAHARSRDLFPTNMGSAEIRELDAAIRRQSVFSARTTDAQYLQSIGHVVDGLLQGEFNEATGRAMLQDVLDLLGYDPATGFPGDGLEIPPAELGSLRDLSSERRVRLILDTQERMAANYGRRREGMDDIARWQFPAYELVRIFDREEERGDWQRRFVMAGGELVEGRMIARKDDPVWDSLGSSAFFTDGLDNPYPPFAWGSGMGWRSVPREEAIALGVIAPDAMPEFTDAEFADELEVNAAQFDDDFLSALEAELEAA